MLGSSQKLGAVWKLPLVAVSRLVATSRLLQADLLGLGAVHVDHELRVVEGLLDAQVGDTGDVLDLVQQLLGEGAVAVHVCADDLDIDGRRKSEVEDLRDHVDGQRVEGDAGKASVERVAQLLHVVIGRVVLFSERNLNVGIGGTDGGGVGIRGIDAAVGQADVVDDGRDLILGNGLADGVVDLIAELSDVFDARAGAGADVNLELAAIDGGEEVLTEKGIEQRPRRSRQRRRRRSGKTRSAWMQSSRMR